MQPERQRQEDALGERGGQPVGEAEMCVRLAERARNPLEPRGQHHRPRDVAARAEHGVGLAAAEDAAAGERRGERLGRRPHELGAGSARQPGDGEGVELVPKLRNEPRLDAIRRPGERHQPVAAPQGFRDGECRRDVPDRPAGRDQEPQLLLDRHHGRC